MNEVELICIEGFWHDEPTKRFEHRCLVIPNDLSDAQRDEVLNEFDNDNIFYVFDKGEAIVGKHLDFEVVFFNPIRII